MEDYRITNSTIDSEHFLAISGDSWKYHRNCKAAEDVNAALEAMTQQRADLLLPQEKFKLRVEEA